MVALQEDAAALAISALLRNAVNSGRFRGVSFIALDSAGRTIYSGAHGHRKFGSTNEPMTVDTAGWMASMTKLMTSVAAMQVVERGLVGLDDDVLDFLPALKSLQLLKSFDDETGEGEFTTPRNKVTLRLLLSHSSGFAYDLWSDTLKRWATAKRKMGTLSMSDWKSYIRPLAFEPGTDWLYSIGIDWVGQLIEVVSGQTLEEFMQANIWSRVGMMNTTFHPELRQSYAVLEMGMRANGWNSPLTPGECPYPIPAINDMGGGGVYSTVEDYGKLLASLVSDNGVLLSAESLAEMMRPQLSDEALQGLVRARKLGLVQIDIPLDVPVDHGLCGLIVRSEIPGRRKAGSTNWDGMSNPQWMVDRTSGIACALFTQVLPCPDPATKALWSDLERIVYTWRK